MVGCRSHSLSDSTPAVRSVDLAALQNHLISSLYDNEYLVFPMRPGRGSPNTFLTVQIDSASYAEQAETLYVQGQILESVTSEPMADVLLMIGNLQQREGRLISADSRRPPTPSYYYRMIPQYEDTTDSEGRFRIHARIDTSSSLMIAQKGYHIKLYNVGRLVDSLRTK